MSAENASSAEEVTTIQSETDSRPRRGPSRWALFAAALVSAIIVLVLLAQCAPRVPDIIGLSSDDAASTLSAAGYKTGTVSTAKVEGTPAGRVAEQTPGAGSITARGASVDFVVALGTGQVVVPDVVGNDTAAAAMQITSKQLTMKVAGQYNPAIPAGAVIAQNPKAGTKVRVKTQVNVVVSLGLEPEPAGGNGVSSGAAVGYTSGSGGSGTTGSESSQSNCTASYPDASVWTSGGDVYIRLTPGAGARRITSGSGWDSGPKLSPDAKHVVFMRAPSSGKASTGVGRVCLTDFSVVMLSLPAPSRSPDAEITYGTPVFAPSSTGTAPGSDWLVTPQYAADAGESQGNDGRLLITNVAMDSTWVSTNINFRPTRGTRLSESSRPGCVRVTQVGARGPWAVADFNAHTGMYFR